MNQRRLAKDPKPSPLRKETRMIKGINQFRNIHIALRPTGASVAPARTPVDDLLFQEAPSGAGAGLVNAPASNTPQSGNYSNDLLSWSVAANPSPQVAASNNSTAAGGKQLPPNAPPPGSYSNDLLELSFGTSPSPGIAATENAGVTAAGKAAHQAKLDPFNTQGLNQATPKAGPPTTKDPPSQTINVPASQPISAGTPFDNTCNSSAVTSPAQPRKMANEPNMTQPQEEQPQPPLLNTTFTVVNNAPALMPQQIQQQPQSIMKSPVTNQPPMSYRPAQQRGSLPSINPPPQLQQRQRTWGYAATTFTQNDFQTAQPQGNSIRASPASNPVSHQVAPLFQQVATSQVPHGAPPNAHGNIQKK